MKRRIGEILIENGSITQEQLQDALERQKQEPGKLLGKILIELGHVTEEDIVIALANQFNVPYLPVQNFVLNEAADQLLPKELIRKYLCIPLEKIGNLLTVVMADPTNEQAICEIETATKCKVQVFVATPSEILQVIQEHYHIPLSSTVELREHVSDTSFRSAPAQSTQDKTTQKR